MLNVNKLVVANWKMNPSSIKEVEFIYKGISSYLKKIKNVETVICPPFPYLYIPKKLKINNIKTGSQDVFNEKEGPYTGEVSFLMLKNFDVKYVIVGHSERRTLGDTNQDINNKILTILKGKATPIFCIGEKERDHNGFYLSYIKQQIIEALAGVMKSQIKNIVFAYEPVWAIGANATRVATVAEFIETRIFIKKIISDLYDIKTANAVRIIYGGSVNQTNAKSFIEEGGADGLLVGRDSLNIKKFKEIINLASK